MLKVCSTKTLKRRPSRHGSHEPTLESHQIEYTRDSVFNKLERPTADPNLDDDYDSEFEHRLAPGEVPTYVLYLMLDVHNESSKPNIEPLVRAMPKEERST